MDSVHDKFSAKFRVQAEPFRDRDVRQSDKSGGSLVDQVLTVRRHIYNIPGSSRTAGDNPLRIVRTRDFVDDTRRASLLARLRLQSKYPPGVVKKDVCE